MDEAELFLWRIERLQAAINLLDDGNLTAFGHRLGLKDGSYVGQMLRGTRAISDKFVRKFEEEHRLPGWFNPEIDHSGTEYRLMTELLSRQIPDHVLQAILEMIRHYPPRDKVA